MIGKIIIVVAFIQAILAILNQHIGFLPSNKSFTLMLCAIMTFMTGFMIEFLMVKAKGGC